MRRWLRGGGIEFCGCRHSLKLHWLCPTRAQHPCPGSLFTTFALCYPDQHLMITFTMNTYATLDCDTSYPTNSERCIVNSQNLLQIFLHHSKSSHRWLDKGQCQHVRKGPDTASLPHALQAIQFDSYWVIAHQPHVVLFLCKDWKLCSCLLVPTFTSSEC